MIGNIDLDNFGDTFDVAKQYDCRVLKETLYQYGKKNNPELYRRG